MRQIILLAWLLSLTICAARAAEAARTPPAPGCLDARRMTEVRQIDARTLVIVAHDGQPYRLGLQSDCPGTDAAADARLFGAEGWICNGAPAYVQTDGRRCAVASVEPLDAKTHALLMQQADRDAMATLDPVKVIGPQRGAGFRGSPSYCFAPRYLRSWSSDPDGLLVEVSRRHPGGHRWYRVELTGSCPMLQRSPTLVFRSGMDLGMICGNPGDVVVGDARPEGFAQSLPAGGCGIAAVYPVDTRK